MKMEPIPEFHNQLPQVKIIVHYRRRRLDDGRPWQKLKRWIGQGVCGRGQTDDQQGETETTSHAREAGGDHFLILSKPGQRPQGEFRFGRFEFSPSTSERSGVLSR